MSKTKKMGRPTIPPEDRRTEQFLIRCSAAELAIIKSADDQPARWARETLLKAAKRAQK